MQSPLVEPLGSGRYRVTVAYHAPDAQDIYLTGGLAGADPADRRLHRGEDGWWTRAYEVEGGTRLTYWFTHTLLPGELIADPQNRAQSVYAADPDIPGDQDSPLSVVELPGAPPWHWSVPRDVPRGDVSSETLASALLGNERRVFLYRPPGYDPAEAYPLVLCFDGQAYTDDTYVPLPTVLDNLLAEGAIPPVVAVLPASLDNETRHRELALDEPFLAFLVEELLPWAQARLSFAGDPARTVVAGSSLGGLTAVFCGVRRPDRFGLILSQSGAFQLGALPAELAASGRLPLRFALDVGAYETVQYGRYPALLHLSVHLRDVLVAKGYPVAFLEHPGGHDYLWWRETIAEGLIALLG